MGLAGSGGDAGIPSGSGGPAMGGCCRATAGDVGGTLVLGLFGRLAAALRSASHLAGRDYDTMAMWEVRWKR
jgi:hypothetical protein